MSNLDKAQDEATKRDPDPYADPISYLAGLGIDAELVRIENSLLGEAA